MSKTWILVLAISISIGGAAAFAEDADYVSNKQCKICHNKKSEGEIWTVWSKQKHAKAYETLGTPEAKQFAEKAGVTGSPQEAPECLRCHVTGYDAEKDPHVPAKIDKQDGVQCESCHGPASLHIKDGKARKMKKDMSVDISAHIVRPDKKTCVKCHNEESPTWDPNKFTLADGTKAGFDFDQAWEKIKHGIPEK